MCPTGSTLRPQGYSCPRRRSRTWKKKVSSTLFGAVLIKSARVRGFLYGSTELAVGSCEFETMACEVYAFALVDGCACRLDRRLSLLEKCAKRSRKKDPKTSAASRTCGIGVRSTRGVYARATSSILGGRDVERAILRLRQRSRYDGSDYRTMN